MPPTSEAGLFHRYTRAGSTGRISTRLWLLIFAAAAAAAALGLAPMAEAKKSAGLRIETVRQHTVSAPLKVQAVLRATPRKVSFRLDGKRGYVTTTAPYRWGGANGSLDAGKLSAGRHRITVRAYFRGGRTAVATTTIRVRKPRRSASAAAGSTTQTMVVTKLPAVTDVVPGTPAPPAAPAPASVPRPPAAWDGSADFGFSRWYQVQDGTRSSQFGNSSVSIVDSPTSSGHKAYRFQVNAGSASNGPRAELMDSFELSEGMDWWFGDVLYVPSNPSRNLGWSVGHHTVMQFKNEGQGAPPLNLDIFYWSPGNASNGLVMRDVAGGGVNYRELVPMASIYDRPIPIEIHVKFSANPNVGFYEVWVDGKRVVAPIKMGTLYSGLTDYFKQGQYGEASGNVVYWLGAKRGTSRESVMR